MREKRAKCDYNKKLQGVKNKDIFSEMEHKVSYWPHLFYTILKANSHAVIALTHSVSRWCTNVIEQNYGKSADTPASAKLCDDDNYSLAPAKC